MLQAKALGCERNKQELFSYLTFFLMPGFLLLVTGPNGIGKTTLLRTLVGLREPSAGSLIWQGAPLEPLNPLFLSQLLYFGHQPPLHPFLTPFENLQGLLKLAQISFKAVDIQLALEVVGLKTFYQTKCAHLSRGQRQRVSLARLWIHPPLFWVLDEPFTALDESMRLLLISRFKTHLEEGGYIVLASHFRLDLMDIPNVTEIILQPYGSNFLATDGVER